MPLLMIRNDITKMQVDAVVNPANRNLEEGRGTSWAIFEAAGEKKLAEACRKIGTCEVGSAALTNGFALPAKYVIHAVCPVWQDGNSGEKELLERTYLSVLRLAKQHQAESVAVPLLSSGFYGYPKAEALHAATAAISTFLLREDMTVYLVLYDHESVEISKRLFASIEEYIDDHYVAEKDEGYLPHADPSAAVCQANTEYREEKRNRKKAGNILIPDFLKRLSPSKGRRLKELMDRREETFSEMLIRLIDERGLKDSVVYRKANIDRRLFSKIRNDIQYAPSKKTVLAFAVALELSLDETKDLLMKAGYAFSNSSKSDIIISFFIENGQYDVFTINEILFAYGQPILGA